VPVAGRGGDASRKRLVRHLSSRCYTPPQSARSFELIDLNVVRMSDADLRACIAAADAVFVSAMSVQKPSLVAVLSGPAQGVDTPWVLGGPYPPQDSCGSRVVLRGARVDRQPARDR